ncbi:hypothetical protein [Pseudogemmobacter faecipullorum]|uniref:DUF4189 domain-containing protein n=1 Tax=Pseudogemmobacter faecipullorum TaxID=2755041 RepID=A0ABS8CIZ3_9RHOB|nr:hypothetical protein [Pseudogemmobacter faecipullorum]MCB5409362.1 hypothetical protein [Pseudogemmobacter faecipullorum]
MIRLAVLPIASLALGLMLLPALAGDQGDTRQNGTAKVTLWSHAFLSEDELAMLRMVQTNDQALAIFVPDNKGFAAMAVSPDDGFLRDGQPVASAIAIAGLPDAQTATKNALAACNQSRKGKKPCVLVLAVEPG